MQKERSILPDYSFDIKGRLDAEGCRFSLMRPGTQAEHAFNGTVFLFQLQKGFLSVFNPLLSDLIRGQMLLLVTKESKASQNG
jgi:hypothetical protein